MADNQNETTVTETDTPIKSVTDLELEKLSARLDALENENRELRNANQGLWAQLHPAQETVTEQVVTVQTDTTDRAYDSFVKNIGLKPNEE